MNDKHWFGFPRTVISIAVAMAAAPVLAQNTTAAIGGRVADAAGKPVAGAAVSIRHVESGSVANVVSDAEGRYSVRGLRVGGPYTVTFTKDGQTDTRNDVFLTLAETTTLDGAIGIGTATVVVTGASTAAARFSTSSMGAGTNIGSRELNSLASIGRNLQDYARTDPRLAQTDKDRGEISALGMNSRFNRVTVDGVSITDTFGLEANNLPTLKQPISIDAIQSVQVNISNYDVTQKGYTGANINAVTKSGTNEFHGSVYYVYRDDDLAGDRYNRTTGTYSAPPAFKEDLKGFTLGGPIIKDKLFFFASYEELASSRSSPTFGPVGSSLTNVGITPTQVAAAQNIARTVYGIEAGGSDVPSGVELTVKDTLLKLDWNVNDNHRANLRYTKTDQAEPIFSGFNATGLSLSSYWWTTQKTNESLVGQWFADWTDQLSTELKVSKTEMAQVHNTVANLPSIQLTFTDPAPAGTATGPRRLLFGTEFSRHFNRLSTKSEDLYAAGTWNIQDHEIKFGADYQSIDIFNAFVDSSKGVYEFSGSDPVALFASGRPTTYTVRLPLAGRTLQDSAANWTLDNLGVFLQDTWKVNRQLSLTGGLRADRVSTDDRPIANTAFMQPLAAGNPATGAAQTGGFGMDNTVSMDGKNLVQPRLGFNFDLTPGAKERRMQMRGGLGLFQGAAMNVWLTNPYQNTGVVNASFRCGAGAAPCPADLRFSADGDNQPTITGVPPAAAVDVIAPNMQQPSVWKANLAFDAELPWAGLVAGAEWVHTRTKHGLHYRHLNLGAPTTTGPDGRPLYYNAQGRSTACWNGSDGLVTGCGGQSRFLRNRNFLDVVLAETSEQGRGDALTLSLAGAAFSRSMNWGVAYTKTALTEVNPLTSSRAISNWANRSVFDPNEDIAGRSSYVVRDRVSGTMSWSKAFISTYRTNLGVFYEGRRGKPYSWTFRNDMNGDGVAGNDLMYVPTAPGSGEVLFYGATEADRAANEKRFWDIVNADSALSGARGTVASRNSGTSPWVNNFDLRFSQEVPGFMAKHKGVFTIDILNFGNLLNKRWGRIDEVGFNAGTVGGVQNNGANARSFVNYAGISNGKYIYNTVALEDYETRQAKGESQWAVQITLKYEF
ncbi:TonB-dependent receptor [Aquincola sp. S2]|uniref:TonB-dependent receptor n=1 Tax=Pseudaquabacterium terrae TaxID=2732868 RepID=A0ABX2EKV1_9BURK|nr:TonB-dependent receptor [Aquabacterium terrae]NRF69226.1 TonB-dependent receptor [Aquabacterium terrae]